MTKIHIMIVNWKWSKKLKYPTFVPKNKAATNGAIEFANDFIFLPATHSGNVEKKNDSFHLKNEIVNRYILPLRVDLSNIDDGKEESISLIQNLRKDYFKKAIQASKEVFPQKSSLEFLFLFHLGDGFDDLSDLLKEIESRDIQIGTFGKATGVLYEEKGLLPYGMAAFRFEEDAEVAWFKEDPSYEAVIIKEENFNFVWNHYWFMTQKRLGKFRKQLLALQLPTASDKLRLDTLWYARNLFARLDVNFSQTAEELEEEQEWDFSQCNDLTFWIDERESNKIFKNELRTFVDNDGDLSNYDHLNSTFDDLMASFLK